MYNQSRGRGAGSKGDKKFGERGPWDRGAGGRDSVRPMYKATCSDCGAPCEVPFRPVGGRPIFCSDCFKKKGNAEPRRPGGADFQRPAFEGKQMYKAVCAACGNACEVPFQPTAGKPIYCKQCFGKDNVPGGKSAGQFKEDFRAINVKLDAILKALSSAPPVKAADKESTMKKTAGAKKVAKKKPAPKKKK
jgi:CxxC-x17-CxxC domain-containing protein